jgi:hypothetical protein
LGLFEQACNQESHLEALRTIQARITIGFVPSTEIVIGKFTRAADAFCDVVSSQLEMDTAKI